MAIRPYKCHSSEVIAKESRCFAQDKLRKEANEIAASIEILATTISCMLIARNAAFLKLNIQQRYRLLYEIHQGTVALFRRT